MLHFSKDMQTQHKLFTPTVSETEAELKCVLCFHFIAGPYQGSQ